MAQIGIDAEIIIDGSGYFVKPGSYIEKQPRVRRATVRLDGGESYVDNGPGKRAWSMVILAKNDLNKYDGTSTGLTGQQYRDALKTSYAGSVGTTINFVDPLNSAAVAVHFDSYAERILDLHTQQVPLAVSAPVGASYECAVVLVEA